jgi:ferredoxin
MSCLRCVQGCPNELIHKSLNPEFKALGDTYWTPDVITKLWQQAETGKIPVSGAGYPGPFSGPGFDAMWTDMSEIVRPTRDGIHGREYISTGVDLGRTPHHLEFTPEGQLQGEVPNLVELPLPILLRVPPFGSTSRMTLRGWALAARHLGTFLALGEGQRGEGLADCKPWLIPDASAESARRTQGGRGPRLVEVPWEEGTEERFKGVRWASQRPLVSVRLAATSGVEEKVVSLAKAGLPILHLAAGVDGRCPGEETLFIKEQVRRVHQALVEAGVRDEVTLLASGGIALAEHVAKTLLCGADCVLVDLPILIALECRVCRRCTQGLSCPVEIENATSAWVAGRVVNLMGAWHNQLLEVMGAMGIRDVRRLRGETGRAMFFEDLDRAAFQDLGKVQEGWELE